MKTVLAYGDSLTWGMDAQKMRRHVHEDLWPSVLGQKLGGGVNVINAGLGGRTTMFDDHAVAADRNGVRILPTVLGMFEPLDLVIFMLGTNDLKTFVNGSAVAAALGIKRLIEITRSYAYEGGGGVPQVLVAAPPHVLQFGPSERFPLLSPRNPAGPSLADCYREAAAATGAEFFDAATVASAEGGGDGVHLDAANTRAIGVALAPVVARMLGIAEAKAA